jgi:nicotinamide-nucleotide amidase
MKTAIITVGKEVLTGKTINTNLSTISAKLNEIGIDVNRSFVIDDQKEEYIKILDFIDEELIFFTGGLGPTIDDITRETVLEYFGVETYLDMDILKTIKGYFDRMDLSMKDTNNKQALMPKEGVLLKNNRGTAPGLYFKANGKRIVLLPGPPIELKPMLEEVIGYLKDEIGVFLYSKGFKLVGTGESYMEKKLNGFYEKHPTVNVAPYAGLGEIKYVFTSANLADLNQCMDEFFCQFEQFIYGDLNDTLEGVIVALLKEKNQTISFAESCTGGMIASAIVNVSGSSIVFKESFVTYANEAKIKYLNVSSKVLEEFGAVSNECAHEMVDGLRKQTGANICLSVTGIAGPTGGTEEKPVGLVYFGLYHNNKIKTFRRVFNGTRTMIRTRAMIYGLNAIRSELLNEKVDK